MEHAPEQACPAFAARDRRRLELVARELVARELVARELVAREQARQSTMTGHTDVIAR
jgi:hypothetical protein